MLSYEIQSNFIITKAYDILIQLNLFYVTFQGNIEIG